MAAHYYPPCPEPHLTVGTAKHSDTTFLTVLLQDGVGGLQALISGYWVDVPPVTGALIINVSAFLQARSNDAFKSVDHRMVATNTGPRVTVACFFEPSGPAASGRVYGPNIKDASPLRYRSFTVAEFLEAYSFDGKPALDRFRL
ncbi:hypothetical protein PR202_gb03512 [Eleusine coracana subsp. coracana]|uniref:Fe2OG dioxygenase domain-containing protein n=1 Tax=Eleusine coracana subsp. coracana TaxID=191504 RepID=A0AAV5DZM0_ELECO|nr:hypothetical protein PR202_gb03512 [Eleusine coracana subsp. coracana]